MTDAGDLSITIAVVSGVVSAASAIIVMLAKTTLNSKESEFKGQIAEARAAAAEARADAKATAQEYRIDSKTMNERLHADEKKTIEQGGLIDRLDDKHDRLDDDLREIKETMATKSDMQQLERTLREISAALLGRQGYAPRMTPGVGRYGPSAGDPPSSPPPQKNR